MRDDDNKNPVVRECDHGNDRRYLVGAPVLDGGPDCIKQRWQGCAR